MRLSGLSVGSAEPVRRKWIACHCFSTSKVVPPSNPCSESMKSATAVGSCLSIATSSSLAALINHTMPIMHLRQMCHVQVDEKPRRVFQSFLHAHQEGDRLAAVDQAVVVAEREVHHRAGDDLAVLHHQIGRAH